MVLERAKRFIYENGRLLDRRRYEYFFENGSKEAVLSVLRAYQNEDGGFGHALEPDIRCPQSQPVATQQEDGGWLINFPAVSPAGEMEWRRWLTVERLKTLCSFGRL